MRQGVDAWQKMGSKLSLPILLAQWAEAAAFVGQVDEGLRHLAEAQKVVKETGEQWWEAELHRLMGELLLRQAIPEESQAEISFRQAHDIARQQQAKSLELRAAMSLSRLWQQQGKRKGDRQSLTEVYGLSCCSSILISPLA